MNALRSTAHKKYCLYPRGGKETCLGDIVNAHTVQRRGGGLTSIARDGHVYGFRVGISPNSTGRFEPFLQGVNRASVFSGFCQRHDNEIFAPLEKQSFECSPEQNFLLSYRAVCRELYYKRASKDVEKLQRLLDQGKDLEAQMTIQSMVWHFQNAVSVGLRHLERYKHQHDEMLTSQSYSDVWHYIVRLKTVPDFVCAGTITPEYDFQGRELQSLRRAIKDPTEIIEYITLSVFAAQDRGVAVFSWVGRNSMALSLMHSLDRLSNEEIPHALVRFVFEHMENVFAAPGWWEGLTLKEQKLLLLRLDTDVGPHNPHASTCLVDDGIRAVNWQLEGRSTNAVF